MFEALNESDFPEGRIMRIVAGDRVEVEWIDHASVDGWHDTTDQAYGTVTILSCGYVLEIDEAEITIAASKEKGGSMGGSVLTLSRRDVAAIRLLEYQ